jgi:hypothetical protein
MVDLDGVICTEERTFDRPLAKPMPGAREALQRLRDAGHTIIIYTGRGWPEFRVAKQWLEDHGMVHDGLHMGKPIADIWIDDRAIRFSDWDAVLKQVDSL